MAQVAVIGVGRFGFHAARLLHQAGHDVLAIDIEPARVQRIRDVSSQAVVLDARDKERLRALSIRDFDVVVLSLGERIDTSSLVALHLKEIGGPRLIAKAGSEDHAKLLKLIGADEIIFPERDAAERLAHRLSNANLLDFIPLGESHSIHELAPPPEFVGKTLADLRVRNRFGVQILAVCQPESDQWNINPAADTQIGESDVLFVLGANKDLDRLKEL
jgi:trk system potassium uptake protein TrkA